MKNKNADTAPFQKWIKKNWSNLALIGVFIVGLLIFLYPTISDYWNSYHASRAIMTYSDTVSNMNEEEYQKEINDALEYNYRLAQKGIDWNTDDMDLTEYNSILDISDASIMGYVKIDKIKVTLPIYHTVDEAVLQVGVGHLENTSLPVGAKSYDIEKGVVTDSTDGSHCVLSGHRGLPSAKLFSDLDKLNEGDIFTIYVLGETYSYQIDQIRVVLPSDVQEIKIVPGQDYCTLLTCTPYGINTHRLLVRGKRVKTPAGEVTVSGDASLVDGKYVAPFIAAPIIIVLVTVVLFGNKKPRKGEVNERNK